jgi:chaperonin GroEL
MSQIRGQVENAASEYDKENLEKRLSALAGKVAVIKVGGATEVQINEAKDRVDDAVAATKAAVAEGIVPGGGVTLVDLSRKIGVEATKVGSSVEAGHLILKQALVQPFRELMRNAGLNPDEKLPQVMAAKGGQGFNVNKPEALADLKADGIVDPAKVTREAIQNAVSIAGTAMTMGSLIVDLPEEKSAPAGGGMPGGMGMGGMDY